MFCPKCGKQLVEGAAFCPGCGGPVQTTQPAQNPTPPRNTPVPPYQSTPVSPPAPAPRPPKQPKAPRPRKPGKCWPTRVLAICVIAALVVGAGLTAGILTLTGRVTWRTPGGMKDPDKLMDAYLERLTDGDMNGILALCDVPGQVERNDWMSYIRSIGLVTFQFPAINGSQAMEEVSQQMTVSSYSNTLYKMCCTILAPDNSVAYAIMENKMINPDNYEEELEAFYRQVGDVSLSGLQVVSCIRVDIPSQMMEDILSNWRKMYASTDMAEYLYLLEREGHYFVGGLTLEQAGGVWNVKDFRTVVSGTANGLEWAEELEGMDASSAREAFLEMYQLAG